MTRTEAFLDTNVLVYAVSQDRDKAQTSRELIARGGVIGVQVLNEFVAVARRKRRAQWKDILHSLATFRETLEIASLTLETHERGLTLAERHNFAIYDAMIVAAAQIVGARTLYTEDMHDGLTLDGLRIVNPYV